MLPAASNTGNTLTRGRVTPEGAQSPPKEEGNQRLSPLGTQTEDDHPTPPVKRSLDDLGQKSLSGHRSLSASCSLVPRPLCVSFGGSRRNKRD